MMMISCDSDMDTCASQPCQNGGECVDTFFGYVCSCTQGYTGKHCERGKLHLAAYSMRAVALFVPVATDKTSRTFCYILVIYLLFIYLNKLIPALLDLRALLGFERRQSTNKGLPLGSAKDHIGSIGGIEASIIDIVYIDSG